MTETVGLPHNRQLNSDTAVEVKVQNQTQPEMSLIENLESLLSDLEEDSPTRMFLDGGMYSEWRPRDYGPRLTYTHPDDYNKEPGDVVYEGSQSWGELLYRRNNQLTSFIVKIAGVCELTQQDKIMQKATSWAWIQEFLGIKATQVQKYSIETEVQVTSTSKEEQKHKKHFKAQTEDDISKQGPSSSFLAQRNVDHSYMKRRKRRRLSTTSETEDENEERKPKTRSFDLHPN